MGGNSGGSSSSDIKYPPYMSSIHSYLLYGYDITGAADKVYGHEATYNSCIGSLQRALSGIEDEGNPYHSNNYSVVDPSTALAQVETALDTLDALVESFDTAADVDAQVEAFEAAQDDNLYRALNRIAGAYAGANAVDGTGFVLGMVLAEAKFQDAVASYRAQIGNTILSQQASQAATAAALWLEYGKLKIVAENDYQEIEADRYARSLKWDLELYRTPGNLLGSIAGSATGDTQQVHNRAASALSGAFSGASIGASIGNAPGAGIGGLIGFGIGMFA